MPRTNLQRRTHPRRMTARCRRIATGMAFALAVTMAPLARAGGGANPGILPPQSHAFGATYSEWSAAHWQWLFSLPKDHHPLFDTADCGAGQSGNVWFLGGTFTLVEPEPGVVVGQVARTCTIPHGKALFFPIINAECSTAEGNGTTEQELSDCATELANAIDTSTLACEIDGRPVANLQTFRAKSSLFSIGSLPADNVLDLPAGTTGSAVSDGFFVLVAPLSTGAHDIHFSGKADLTSLGGPLFILDITYDITVGH